LKKEYYNGSVMKSIENLLLVLTVGALVLFAGPGCGNGDSTVDQLQEKRIYTEKDSIIRVTVKMEFSIILESNPTTGYSWTFSNPLDTKVIDLTGDEFISPDNLRKGAPGKQLWTFRVVGEGETAISLEYIRPWEKGKPPVRAQTFTVISEKSL
jgi:inhibitor of cysteine peptidase